MVTPEQLARMPREEKERLLLLVEEKRRRALEARPKFKPHEGQLRVIASKALERYLFCGNGFGKSTVLVNEVHWAATGFNPITGEHTPVPAKICLVLPTADKIDDFITEYRKWFPLKEDQLHKKGKAEVSFIDWETGSTLTVITHEVSELKLEGSQWTHIFMDEPPPRNVFIALFRGGRIKGRPVRVLLAGTPIKAAWLRTDVYEPWRRGEMPHVECFQGQSEENRSNLEDGWLERFGSRLSEKEKEIRLKGGFYDLDGLALAHLFRDPYHVLASREFTWDQNNPCVVVMDPHPSKAHHAILMGADRDNRLYVLAEYKEKVLARRFIQNVIELGWFSGHKVMDIVYDSLGSSESTSGEGYKPFGKVVNEELEKAGIGRARATRYEEKDDEEWVERIRDVLAIPEEPDNFGNYVPKLRFLDVCGGTISDVKNVQWKQDKLKENAPKLDISNKDFLSCVKYALATNLHFEKKKEKAYYRTKKPYGLDTATGAQGQPRRPGALFLSRRKRARPEADQDDDD